MRFLVLALVSVFMFTVQASAVDSPSDILARLISTSAKGGADIGKKCALDAVKSIFVDHLGPEEAYQQMESCVDDRFNDEGLSIEGAVALVREAMSISEDED